MTTSDPVHEISPEQLPEAINTYLAAHQARDIDTALSYYTDDATVIDEGSTYHGPDQIRDWLQRSAGRQSRTGVQVGELHAMGDNPPPHLPTDRAGDPLDRPSRAARPTPEVGRRATPLARRQTPRR